MSKDGRRIDLQCVYGKRYAEPLESIQITNTQRQTHAMPSISISKVKNLTPELTPPPHALPSNHLTITDTSSAQEATQICPLRMAGGAFCIPIRMAVQLEGRENIQSSHRSRSRLCQTRLSRSSRAYLSHHRNARGAGAGAGAVVVTGFFLPDLLHRSGYSTACP